jgi:hypothetical protein
MGIEPTSEAWEASILPLYDARSSSNFLIIHNWAIARTDWDSELFRRLAQTAQRLSDSGSPVSGQFATSRPISWRLQRAIFPRITVTDAAGKLNFVPALAVTVDLTAGPSGSADPPLALACH